MTKRLLSFFYKQKKLLFSSEKRKTTATTSILSIHAYNIKCFLDTTQGPRQKKGNFVPI